MYFKRFARVANEVLRVTGRWINWTLFIYEIYFLNQMTVTISTGNSQFMLSSSYRTLMLCSNKSYIESKVNDLISISNFNLFKFMFQYNWRQLAWSLRISLPCFGRIMRSMRHSIWSFRLNNASCPLLRCSPGSLSSFW